MWAVELTCFSQGIFLRVGYYLCILLVQRWLQVIYYNHRNTFLLQTKRCGWGAVALEPLERGDFVIEYVGEGKVVFHVIIIFGYRLTEIARSPQIPSAQHLLWWPVNSFVWPQPNFFNFPLSVVHSISMFVNTFQKKLFNSRF